MFSVSDISDILDVNTATAEELILPSCQVYRVISTATVMQCCQNDEILVLSEVEYQNYQVVISIKLLIFILSDEEFLA